MRSRVSRPFVLQVSVLTHKEHEVTVEARISTTSGPPAAASSAQRSSKQQQEEAVSCGDFFVAVDGDDGACSSWFYQI
jgi:hypothetical protein